MPESFSIPEPTPVPAALPLQPAEAVPLSPILSIVEHEGRFFYFLNTQPIASHTADDKLSRNLCLARCALFELAPQVELARFFGLHPATVRRARERLRLHGEAGFARPRKTRRRHGIVDPHLLEKAGQLLQSGVSVYRTAKQLCVSCSTLWRYTKEGRLPPSQSRFRGPARVPAERLALPQTTLWDVGRKSREEAAAEAAVPDREQRNLLDAQAPMGRAAHDTEGRVAASLGSLNGREPHFQAASAVTGGGLLTAVPALLKAGLLKHLEQLRLPKGFYGQTSLMLLWTFLLLGRVRHAERLRYEQPGEWGALLGLDRCPHPRTLRRRTRQLAASEGLPGWVGSLSREWCEQETEAVATLFVDGHVQVYSGQGKLPKHFVPRQKLALPAAASYWVHTLGGAPLLCLHRQVDGGMVQELRKGVLPRLRELGVLEQRSGEQKKENGEQQGENDGTGKREPRLTLVFDREGWSPDLFRELAAQGIAVVTWIKGRQKERWPESEFRDVQMPVQTPGGQAVLEGKVAERPLKLFKDFKAREVRFWAHRRLRGEGKNGRARASRELAGRPGKQQRQPSVVTTHPSLPAEKVAGLLRSRWAQENFFKYQRAEFGLDTLPEHRLVEMEPDARIVNPVWREIEKALKKERNTVGHLRRKRALERDGKSKKAQELEESIRRGDEQIEGLAWARRLQPRHMLAGELDARERLQALPEPLRMLMDTLRMVAYRAETAMARVVAPRLDNPDTARSLLQSLYRSDASLYPNEQEGTLNVRLLHQATRAQDRALEPLLEELNGTRTLYPGTRLRLVYSLVGEDEAHAGPTAGGP